MNTLTLEEEKIIVNKSTEPPFSGEYDDFYQDGTYLCKRCNNPLFNSQSKFNAGCGWPSFDEYYKNAVKTLPDPDGIRTEIECANCSAHLGHVFLGEKLTAKNTRHCVNSLALKFVPTEAKLPKIERKKD